VGADIVASQRTFAKLKLGDGNTPITKELGKNKLKLTQSLHLAASLGGVGKKQKRGKMISAMTIA